MIFFSKEYIYTKTIEHCPTRYILDLKKGNEHIIKKSIEHAFGI